MATLNISLPSELAELIEEKVASGMYLSASEMIGESLRLLKEHDEIRLIRLEALRKELAIAEKQIENGETIPFTSAKDYAERIKAEGRRIMDARGKKER